MLLAVLVTLAVLSPWEIGAPADPLSTPAHLKPEWYFLWVYQLLKEFPPHILGMEGPQACLLLVFALLGLWAAVPWLDRRARRDLPSPEFSDLAFAAMIFLTFLTLKAWDIGVEQLGAPGADAVAARNAAWWTLGLSAATYAVRAGFHEHRWFFLSGIALGQVVLHGMFGLTYIEAGVAAGAAGLVLFGFALSRAKGQS